MSARLLMIDNYDSFTYNLVQAFRSLGAQTLVYRNDSLSLSDALDLEPTHVVISPGPGRPENAGICLSLIAAMAPRIPLLGVCLGHQSLVAAFGGEIIQAKRIMHGKTSSVTHDGEGVFAGLPQPLVVGRYHSLAAASSTLPDEFKITAQTDDGEIMGVRHRALPVEGVQFHPESVLTPDGERLMANFLALS